MLFLNGVSMMKDALNIAHWFANRLQLSKSLSDQAKLQKLLFFSWLIHYANHKNSLFKDEFCAFENGPVVWDVLYMPPHDYDKLLSSPLPEYTAEEINSLELTFEIFGDAECDELIELSHESPAWNKYYHESKIHDNDVFTGAYDREKQIIPKNELNVELRMIKNLLFAHKNKEELGY